MLNFSLIVRCKLLLLIGVFANPMFAAELPVATPEAFKSAIKNAQPGDSIILQDGTWTDASLIVRASGTAEKPLTIKAQTPGKVIFSGDSNLSIAGHHVIVNGLWFQNPTGEESIELRANSDELASDCRITQCAVTSDGSTMYKKGSSRFISVYGDRHRIDHCYFAGKSSEGPTMVVWLADGIEAGHQIDHNHFGPREPLGENGGETIRLGDSETSMLNAACTIEHNLFEKCNGEAECISNKSCGNIYRNNRFIGVSGTLTLRHGNDCRVENNVFIGDGARGTGGVRVIGEGHVITGNYFEGLSGDDERSAMCLMLGVPNSPENEYFQVKRVTVSENTFLNCKQNILIGMKGDKKATLPPIESTITNNFVHTNRAEAFDIRCDVSGVVMKDNHTGKEPPRSKAPANTTELAGPAWRPSKS